MSAIPFDPEALRDAFPESYLDRGSRYFRAGRVLSADYNPAQGLVTGRVSGSGGRVYQSIVHLGHQEDGALMVVGHCSCPVGYNCKHVVAVLLSVVDRAAKGIDPQPSGQLPLEVSSWLNRVERVAASTSDEDPHRLLYLLRCERKYDRRRTHIHVVRVRRLESGGFGKPKDYNINGQSKAPFVMPEDLRIMMLMEVGRGQMATADVMLADEISADVLRAIVLTGRGHWGGPETPALRLASPLAGRLVWRLGQDARLRVVLEADRPGLEPIPVSPPWYLDPETGDCGPLETGLGEREAGLLAMAPSIAPETADALQEAAEERLKGRPLPLPLPQRPERRRVTLGQPVPCLQLQSEDRSVDFSDRFWLPEPRPEWHHCAVLTFLYDGASVVDPSDGSRQILRVEQDVLVESERDLAAEAARIQTLRDLDLRQSRDIGDSDGLRFELPDDSAWLRFMGRDVPRLRQQGWRIEAAEGFRFQVARLGDWQIDISEGEGGAGSMSAWAWKWTASAWICSRSWWICFSVTRSTSRPRCWRR